MAPHVVALITAASDPYPCRRIQKFRGTLLRTSVRVYRTLAFDVLHHGKFTPRVLRELSNFCCLPGRAGGSPNGLVHRVLLGDVVASALVAWPSWSCLLTGRMPVPRRCGMAILAVTVTCVAAAPMRTKCPRQSGQDARAPSTSNLTLVPTA